MGQGAAWVKEDKQRFDADWEGNTQEVLCSLGKVCGSAQTASVT